MQAAVSSACLFPMQTEDALAVLGQNGIRKAELFLNAPQEASPAFAKQIREISARYGTNIVSVHPWTATAEGFMLFSRYERRCEDFLEEAKRIFSLMNEVGAKIYILHGALQNRKPNIELYCERYERLFSLGQSFGITVTHENVVDFVGTDLTFLQRFCSLLGERARLTFDVKQAVRSGISIPQAVETLAPHIAHVHLSGHGSQGDCLRVSQSSFDFVPMLTQLQQNGFDGSVVLELYREAFSLPQELAEDYQLISEKIAQIQEKKDRTKET